MDFYTLDTSSLAIDQREDLLIRCRDNLKVLTNQLDEERELRRLAEKEAQNLKFELIYFEERLTEHDTKQYVRSSDITIYEQENKDIKKQLHFINQQLKEVNHDKDSEKARADELAEELENLHKLFEESKSELEEKQASFDKWQMTLHAVEIQLRSLSDENRNLNEDVKRYKVQYDTILEQAHKLQDTVRILQEDNQNLQDRISYPDTCIPQDKNNIQQEIQKALDKINATHSEQENVWRGEISASVKKLQSYVDESKLNLTNVEKDKTYLQVKVHKLKEKKKNLLNMSVIEKQTLENELEKLRKEINAHRIMLQKQTGIKDKVISLEKHLNESRIENEKTLMREKKLVNQCTNSYNAIKSLKNEIREKEARIMHFEQRLGEMQQKLRNIELKNENEINEHRKVFNTLVKEYEQEKIQNKQDTARTLQNNHTQQELEKLKLETSQLKLSYQALQSKRNEDIQNLNKDRERLQSSVIELQKQLESVGIEITHTYNEKLRRSPSYPESIISDSSDHYLKRLTNENYSLKQEITSKSEELDSKESELTHLKDSFKKRLQSRIFECENKVSKWRDKFLEEMGYIQRWMETLKRDRNAYGILDKVEGMLSRLDTVLSCTHNIEYIN